VITNTYSLPPNSGPDALAVSPDGSTLYVANEKKNTVSVIDRQFSTVIPNVGGSPSALVLSPDGDVLYVMNAGRVTLMRNAGTVTLIKTADPTADKTTIHVGSNPSAMVFY